MTESQLQAQVLNALGWRGIKAWRMNTGAARQGGRFVRFGIKGQADITGLLPSGRRLEVECKTEDGRQSLEQVAFQKMITASGGLYVVVRSVEDLEKVWAHV